MDSAKRATLHGIKQLISSTSYSKLMVCHCKSALGHTRQVVIKPAKRNYCLCCLSTNQCCMFKIQCNDLKQSISLTADSYGPCCCCCCCCRVSRKMLGRERLAVISCLLFVLNPATVHHSMPYTEAIFTAASFTGLYCMYCLGSSTLAALSFAASAATRSNGMEGLDGMWLCFPLVLC